MITFVGISPFCKNHIMGCHENHVISYIMTKMDLFLRKIFFSNEVVQLNNWACIKSSLQPTHGAKFTPKTRNIRNFPMCSFYV